MDYYPGETVGLNVRRLRQAARPPLRQADLARLTGYHQTVISSLEVLRDRVSQQELDTLATAFGLDSTEELLRTPEIPAERYQAKGAGAALRDRRMSAGLSQRDVAHRLATTQFQVSVAERGNPAALAKIGDDYARILQDTEVTV